jgi:C1A family cysteine protease
MKTATSIIIAGTVCAVALVAFFGTSMPSSSNLFMQPLNTHPREQEFLNWIQKHGRSYGTKEEYLFRRDLFMKKLEELEAFNKDLAKPLVGVNQFSDWTDAERKKLFGLNYDANRIREETVIEESNGDISNGIDWRTSGKVTPVKDQK